MHTLVLGLSSRIELGRIIILALPYLSPWQQRGAAENSLLGDLHSGVLSMPLVLNNISLKN